MPSPLVYTLTPEEGKGIEKFAVVKVTNATGNLIDKKIGNPIVKAVALL